MKQNDTRARERERKEDYHWFDRTHVSMSVSLSPINVPSIVSVIDRRFIHWSCHVVNSSPQHHLKVRRRSHSILSSMDSRRRWDDLCLECDELSWSSASRQLNSLLAWVSCGTISSLHYQSCLLTIRDKRVTPSGKYISVSCVCHGTDKRSAAILSLSPVVQTTTRKPRLKPSR